MYVLWAVKFFFRTTWNFEYQAPKFWGRPYPSSPILAISLWNAIQSNPIPFNPNSSNTIQNPSTKQEPQTSSASTSCGRLPRPRQGRRQGADAMKHLAISNHVDSSHDRAAGARSLGSLNWQSTLPPLSPTVSTRSAPSATVHRQDAASAADTAAARNSAPPPLVAAAACVRPCAREVRNPTWIGLSYFSIQRDPTILGSKANRLSMSN